MSSYLHRLLQIRQVWGDFSEHAVAEKMERSNDVQCLLDTLERKVTVQRQSQIEKIQVFGDELNNIGEVIREIRAGLEKAKENEEREVEAGRVKAEQRSFEITQEIKGSGKNIFRQHMEQTNKIRDQVQKENKRQMGDLAKTVNQVTEIKQFVEKRLAACHNAHKTSLGELTAGVEEELRQMQDYLEQRRGERVQKEQKLRYMVESLLVELEGCVEREQRFGKINYECQLNLIEDFHAYVKNKSMLL